ncbi:hypothetical protein P7C71_g5803, partial [Lecanoromycetidae sp. Uapishka_2]
MPIEAAPIVVEPSGNFLGDDGAWSTFLITAGTPPQQLEVFASTQVASTWVVSPDGCGINDAPNCTESRGGAYDDTKSSTWNSKGIFLLGDEINLGYTGPNNIVNGTYGYDTLALQRQGVANVSVDHQVLAAIITDDFYVGNLGLSNQAINVSATDSSPSLLSSLRSQNLIPSASYGYTAGASYQQKNGVNGSLTLGGLYTINDTTHSTLLKENPSVVIELANSQNGPSVNITLPYASFDLTANYPLVKNQTRFFPLQRGSDDIDYDNSNFSISQAVYDPSTPSHIVAISSSTTTGTTSSNPTASGAPIVKTTNNNAHGIGTGAIAGIAIAIVLIASLIGAFFIRKHIQKHKRIPKAHELEADKPEDTQEMSIEYATKKDFSSSDGPEAKNRNTLVEVKEIPVTPAAPLSEMDAEMHGFFGDDVEKRPIHQELPGSPVNRSEMSSPEPLPRHELPSPDPDMQRLRSELSTPEPMYLNSELPTPDPSHELPSPGISSTTSSLSPGLVDSRRSGLNSPEPRLPIQRPQSHQFDSSESEAGLTFDRRVNFHRRYHSDDSDFPTLQSIARPSIIRHETSDSESDFIHVNNRHAETSDPDLISPISRPTLTHVDSSASESEGVSSLPTITSRPRVSPTHLDSSSGEESPAVARPPAPFRHVVGLASNFYSSSVSRPAMRRSVGGPSATPQRPASNRYDESDSDAWQTRLDSPSTEAPSDVSRFNSVNRGTGS